MQAKITRKDFISLVRETLKINEEDEEVLEDFDTKLGQDLCCNKEDLITLQYNIETTLDIELPHPFNEENTLDDIYLMINR